MLKERIVECLKKNEVIHEEFKIGASFGHFLVERDGLKAVPFDGENGTIWEVFKHFNAPIAENWADVVPDFIIAVGIMFLLYNLLKSIISMCGAIKVRRYALSSSIYVITLLVVLMFHLIGWEAIGFKKMDFMEDVIGSWQQNEIVGLLITGLIEWVCSLLVKIFNYEKYGYLR